MSIVEQNKEQRARRNPLSVVWNIFSVLFGLFGLSSVADSFVKWKGFIQQLIFLYRSIFYPIFDYLFSWVWFTVPTYIYDYLVIGFLIATSYVRALHAADNVQGYSFGFLPSALRHEDLLNVAWQLLYRIFLWPTILIYYLYKLLDGFNEGYSKRHWKELFTENFPSFETIEGRRKIIMRYNMAIYIEAVKFFQWLAAIVFFLVILLTINVML